MSSETNHRFSYHYPSESHMRTANPYIGALLANIATLEDGIYTATEAGITYTWNASGHQSQPQ